VPEKRDQSIDVCERPVTLVKPARLRDQPAERTTIKPMFSPPSLAAAACPGETANRRKALLYKWPIEGHIMRDNDRRRIEKRDCSSFVDRLTGQLLVRQSSDSRDF
jgi:hypothetical protein